MDALVEINRYLDAWLLRYRLQQAARWAILGLLFGLLCAGSIAWWAVPAALLLLSQFILLTVGMALSGFLIAGLAGFLWPVKRGEAIRFFDRRFNLQERISTAVEFFDQPGRGNNLLAAQRQDALEHARRVNPQARLPWRIPWPELGAALVLILAIAGLAIHNQPHFLAAMQKQDLIKRIQEQAARLEEIQLEIQQLENLTPEQRNALEAPIEEAARRLAASQSVEEALSALNQAEEELSALAPADLQKQASGLQQAGEAIRSREGTELEPFGENLAQGNFSQAAQELASINPVGLSADQQSGLAGDLQAASEALSGSNPELAQNLHAAAEALQSGDTRQAGQSLSQAAQSLGAKAGELASASAAGQATAQLGASQQSLAQASLGGQAGGSNSQAAAGSQATSGQSAGQINGQGNREGQGSGGESSNSGSSGGSGRGESQGGESGGAQAGSQPIDTANQPGDGGERRYESIYAPQRLDTQAGQDVRLPGSGQPGQVIGQAGQAPGAFGENLIPYTEVYPAYESVARQAIESGQIPQHLRALVRDYFSSLAP